ncbi:hypothetical protein B0T21DRAFT_409137 [Apiosordaria backusii]|uniref:Uncharacterized protein n=1 Tax=Apiosordaria backusii TaxID=314023 RepID=A0AA40EN00_9PEZI|nr:hypothetical protein B0T21DRAFT_409137 [Apiosordaria backusii]
MGLFHDKRDHGDINVPEFCFSICDHAHNEAQGVGKEPGLCAAGSAFREFYEGCRLCIVDFQGRPHQDTNLLPRFQEYIDYCVALVGLPPLPPPPSPKLSTTTTTTVPATTTITEDPIMTSVMTITSTSTLSHTTVSLIEASSTTQSASSTIQTSTSTAESQSSPPTTTTFTTKVSTSSCITSTSSLVSTTLSSTATLSSTETAGITIFDTGASATPISTNDSTPERNIHSSNTVMISAVVGSVVGVALLLLLGMAYWSRRVKRAASLSPTLPQLAGRSVLVLNPQGPLQEMGEHHGYNELDVPRVWCELDARSLRSLNRSLRWVMSGARSPGHNSQNRGDTPEISVREGV